MRSTSPLLHRQRAFTLVEMLVVISILMLLLGLTIGSIMRTPKADALLATEQLLGDMIRQARHTARSTGAPVLLEISQTDRTVVGVAQVPIWSETFEEDPASTSYQDWFTPGQTGQGITNPTTESVMPPDLPPSITLPPNQALTRNATATEGFVLSCAVLPPDAGSTSVGTLVPLLLIGASADDSAAQCGLALVDRSVEIQTEPLVNPQGSQVTASYQVWDVEGFVNDASGTFYRCSSIDQSVVTPRVPLPGDGTGTNPSYDVAGPIVGGHWEDLALAYSEHGLDLLRNGEVIATLPATATWPRQLLAAPQSTIWIGQGTLGRVATALGFSPPGAESYLLGTLDNCRLFRLGTDQPSALPMGVVPGANYHLRVRPDGIVDFSTDQTPVPSTGGTMTFAISHEVQTANGPAESVGMNLGSDGSLTTWIITAGPTASATASGIQ